jgi:peptidoglycan/LPS O-acetylase OafA/YrhL
MRKLGPGLFRLFLALAVVVHHSFPLRLGTWAVYVFFILSGYWICRMWRQRYIQTHNPLLTFMVSRWWRLAPVFLLCTALSVVSSFLLNGSSALQMAGSLGWWLREFLIAGANGAGTELPPSWSLDVEMQFYLVAPLLITVFGRIGPFFRWLTAGAACGWCSVFLFRGGNVQPAHLSLFVGFFLMGVTLQIAQWKPSRATATGSLLVFLGITLIMALSSETQCGVWKVGVDPAQSPLVVNLWWIVGAGVILPFLAWNVSQDSAPFDRLLGNLAYPLYLFHWIPREWYHRFSLRADPVWKQCTLLGINFLAAGAGAIVILLLVDRPSERFREAWVASRKKIKGREGLLLRVAN